MPWTASPPDTTGIVTVAAATLGKQHGVMRYLVDATAIVRQPREVEFFVLPARMYDELGLDRNTACLNRGWQVHVFDAFDTALAWLGAPAAGV